MKEYKESFKVTKDDCISAISSSLPDILGTYSIVKFMKIVSAKNINRFLDTSKYITVGERVDIEHINMVKLGDTIEICSTIIKEQKRDIFFEIKATLNGKTIATATHKRVKIPLKILNKIV